MRPPELATIRRRLEQAVDDINYFLTRLEEREKAREEAGITYDSMEVGRTPPKVKGRRRFTKTQNNPLVHGTSVRGSPLADAEREAILAKLGPAEPLSDAGREALAFWARGGWLESSRQAAAWLRKAGENVAADGIDEALRPLFDEPRDASERSAQREAMRTAAGYVKTILTACLEGQAPAPVPAPESQARPSNAPHPADHVRGPAREMGWHSMNGADRQMLVTIFADAMQVADDAGRLTSTPDLDRQHAERISREVPRLMGDLFTRLERVPSIPDIPPKVHAPLAAVARIVRGTRTECVSYGDLFAYLAQSDLRNEAAKGWHAMVQSKPENQAVLAWAGAESSLDFSATVEAANEITNWVEAAAAIADPAEVEKAMESVVWEMYRGVEDESGVVEERILHLRLRRDCGHTRPASRVAVERHLQAGRIQRVVLADYPGKVYLKPLRSLFEWFARTEVSPQNPEPTDGIQIVQTAGDLWLALDRGLRPVPPPVSAVSIKPPRTPINLAVPKFPAPGDQAIYDSYDKVRAYCTLEGGSAGGMEKLIARIAIHKGINRAEATNMPIVEFATACDAIHAPSTATTASVKAGGVAPGMKVHEAPMPETSGPVVPVWHRDLSVLQFGKWQRKIRPIAKNMIRVLVEFQESGWPRRIDDPLPNGPNDERLRQTVRALNSVEFPIVFESDGTGQGICWKVVDVAK
jgi:hypothetical protein